MVMVMVLPPARLEAAAWWPQAGALWCRLQPSLQPVVELLRWPCSQARELHVRDSQSVTRYGNILLRKHRATLSEEERESRNMAFWATLVPPQCPHDRACAPHACMPGPNRRLG